MSLYKDLNTLNENTKNTLSVFDKNNDDKLSTAEINDAIIDFSQADRTYSTTEKKGQRIVHGDQTLQVLNYKKQAYKNPDFAAKVAGLTKFGEGYKNEDNGRLYIWDSSKCIFKVTNMLTEITDHSIVLQLKH